MHTLLIVDDEPIEREGLRLLICGNIADITIVGEAENGYEAIEQFKKFAPDIVFIDITMPGMNGLKAVEEMMKMDIVSHFVLITSYSLFDYAQKAIHLGVEDFLLKPADLSSIRSILDKIICKIKESKLTLDKEITLSKRVKELEPVVERDLIHQIHDGIQVQNYGNLLNLMDIKMKAACVIHLTCLSINTETSDRIKLQINSKGFQCISGLCDKIIILVIIQDESNNLLDSEALIKYLILYLEKNYTKDFKLGGGQVVSIPEQLALSSKIAGQCLSHSIQENIPYCTNQKLQKYYNYDYGLNGLSLLLEQIHQGNESDINHIVKDVINIILTQFSNPISLEQIAERLNLSTFYISKIVKKETGLNISDIITEIRVMEAKKLLSKKQLNIKEITYKIGFNSQNYFSRVFKKYTGFSPTEYKKQHEIG